MVSPDWVEACLVRRASVDEAAFEVAGDTQVGGLSASAPLVLEYLDPWWTVHVHVAAVHVLYFSTSVVVVAGKGASNEAAERTRDGDSGGMLALQAGTSWWTGAGAAARRARDGGLLGGLGSAPGRAVRLTPRHGRGTAPTLDVPACVPHVTSPSSISLTLRVTLLLPLL